MQEYGISYDDRYSHISDERLREVIQDIRRDHCDMGEIMIMGHLRSRRINVQRHRVRLALEQMDPEGKRKRTEYLGFPLHVRTDHGGENVKVWEAMYDHYGSDVRPVLTGRSVHNQRAERNNRDLNACITTPFKQIFMQLENDGHLDVDNETDMFCLHYVYIPRINNALVAHLNAHNNHKISTEASATPSQLFYANNHLRELFVNTDTNDQPSPAQSPAQSPELSVVTVPSTTCPISDEHFLELEAIDPLKDSTMQGKDIFLEVVDFVGNALQQVSLH